MDAAKIIAEVRAAREAGMSLTGYRKHLEKEAKKRTTAEIRKARHTRTHGTIGGYMQHRYRKEDACIQCKKAWREYYRAYAAKRRAADAKES